MSFTAGSLVNITIKSEKNEIDKKIKNETYEKYNETFLYEEFNNTNITKIIYDKIYDSDRDLFLKKYFVYYVEFMAITILLYLIMLLCFFSSDKKKEKTINTLENSDNQDKDSDKENLMGKEENE